MTYYKDHPFSEEADLIDDILRAQRDADRRGTGQCFTGGEHHEVQLREKRDTFRHLARLDVDEGRWPDNDGFVERNGALIPE